MIFLFIVSKNVRKLADRSDKTFLGQWRLAFRIQSDHIYIFPFTEADLYGFKDHKNKKKTTTFRRKHRQLLTHGIFTNF